MLITHRLICAFVSRMWDTGHFPVLSLKRLFGPAAEVKGLRTYANNQYKNMPIHIHRKFHLQKLIIFRKKKNSDIFHISAQNIDCWYSLEPPRRGGSNEYPQSMFLSRNKKNNVYPCKPQFFYIKVGLRGSKLYRHVFVMDDPDQPTHSGQDIRCLPAQYRELLEDIRIIAKILTRRVAAQTGQASPMVSALSCFVSRRPIWTLLSIIL